MAPSGSPPRFAAKTAPLRREPIVLRGFDRRRQLDISFQTVPFGAAWLRRTYTNEHAQHITLRTRDEDGRLPEVRYGNNITVLLKACYQLRQFYNSRDFWPAIARGFGTSADTVRDMVEVFVDARSIYRRNNPDEVDITRSGANVAADRWIDFLANQERGSRTGFISRNSEASSSEIFGHARDFFNDSEGRQVDLANVLPKRIDYQQYGSSESRKRFSSPEPPEAPRSPKRKPSSNHFDRSDTLSARISQPLTPLSTSNPIRGSARQDYQTPISASDRPAWTNSHPQGSPDIASEVFLKIGGTASQTKNSLPAIESRVPTPNPALSNGSSDMESHKMQDKMASLEKELYIVKSRLSDDQHHRDLLKAILSDYGLIGNNGLASTPDPAIKSMQAQIASLEAKIEDEAARHALEIKYVKESIQIAKQEISMSNNSVKREMSASSNNWDMNPGLHALKSIQGKLASIEDRLLAQGTAEVQTKLSELESRVTITQPQTSEASIPVNQHINDKLSRSNTKVVETGTEEHDRITTLDMLDKISRLEDGVSSISDRVTRIEAKPNEVERICELQSRIQVIEHQCDKDQRKYVTKDSVATMFEQLESRLAQEKNATSKQLQDIHSRLMAMEIQSSKLLKKTTDVSETPRSPSSSCNMQRNIDEILKTIDSLPSEAYVTDMIFKREQLSKSENEKIWRSMDGLSTKIGSLPTATLVSDMVDNRNKSFSSDITKLRRKLDDTLTKIDSLPNRAYISERLFCLEQSLRAELVKHQKDTESVVEGTKGHLGILQAQVKGLNKLWNEATTGMAKSDSLVALKIEIDTLKGDIAKQSMRIDDSSEGLNQAREGTIAALGRQVVDLSAQIRTTLSEVTLENLVKRLQEAPNEIAAQSAARDARVDNVLLEVEKLHARDTVLAKALYDVGQLMRPA